MRPLRSFALRNYITLGLCAVALIVFLVSGLRPASGSRDVSPLNGNETTRVLPAVPNGNDKALTLNPRSGPASNTRSNPLKLRLLPASVASPFAAVLTATKTDNLSVPANPGDTIMYTVTITNSPAMDATNVMFSDMIDANTMLVGGSVASSPIAFNDTYTASGNITIAPATSVLANDIDPDTGNNTGLTVTQVQGSGAAVGNPTNTNSSGIGGVFGSVTLQANGTFTYEPPPGFTGNDTFTYQISDASGKTGTGTVTITISQMVWFIDNSSVAANSRGTFSQPFKTIADFNAVNTGAPPNPQPGNFIALRRGTGTYTEADGINLRDNQKLIGEAVQFNTVFTADANSSAAYNTFASGTMAAPVIVVTGGTNNGVDLALSNTVRGLNVGNTTGFDISGSAVGSPVINTVALTGTGGAINVTTSGAFAANVTFSTLESTSSTGANINLVGVTGTLGVTSGGTGLSGSAATAPAININGGSVSMSYPGDVTKNNANSLLSVSNGHTTPGTLTFTGTLNASAGNGLQFDNADGTYNFNGTTTLSGGDAGVDILNGSGGTFSFNSTTTITSPTGTAFNVNTGSPSVTYSGVITQNTAGQRVVNIDATTANTITFNTGAITGGANSTGININNVNGNVSFANMTLGTSGSRMINQAVTIAGGTGTYSLGVVSIFTNNAQGIAATLADGTLNSTSGTVDSTNATAINIDGPAGLTSLGMSLTTVNSSGGNSDGISIQDTNGSFTVVGTGTAASGGTIATKNGADGSTSQGIGIFLSNTQNISLDRMQLNAFQNFAIRGLNVTGFTFKNSVINGNSGTSNAQDEAAISFDNLLGSALIDNTSISGGYEFNVDVVNTSGTLDRLTFSGNTVGAMQASGNEDDSFHVEGKGTPTGAVIKLTVSDSIFTSAKGDIINIGANENAQMTGGLGVEGLRFLRNKVSNNHPSILSGGGGTLIFSGGAPGQTGSMTYDISCNTFRDAKGVLLDVFKGNGTGTATGSVVNNGLGVTGVANSGGDTGLRVRSLGTGSHTIMVRDNDVRSVINDGMLFRPGEGSSTMNATILNNTIGPLSGATPETGLFLETGSLAADTTTLNVVVGSATNAADKNDLGGTGGTAADVVLLRTFGTFNLSRNGSAAGTATQVIKDDNNGNPSVLESGTINLVAGLPTTPPTVAACVRIASVVDEISAQAKPSERDGDPEHNHGDVLRSAPGEGPHDENIQKLKQEELNWMVQAAIARWVETGISAEDLARLQAATFDVSDLPEGQIASFASNHITIDETGAGYGWYFDQSTSEDGEFQLLVPGKELQTTRLSPARGKMDLLTVVMRELGQLYLQNKNRTPDILRPMMEPTLSPGVRRLPLGQFKVTPPPTSTIGSNKPAESESVQAESNAPTQASTAQSSDQPARNQTPSNGGKIPPEARYAVFNPAIDQRTATGAVMRLKDASDANNYAANRAVRVASMSPAGGMVNVGPFTLPAGKSVTIMFNVTINNPVTPGTVQVCNQGTVTADGPISIMTDDPDTGAVNDATCTPLNVADLSVTKTDSPDPVTAGNNITYTVTVTNNGPAVANNVTLNDAVPTNTTFVSTTTPAGWSRDDATAVGATGTLMFSKASMANAETAVFTIVVKVNSNTANGTTITNNAVAATTSPDPTGNNTGTATTTVQASADLSVTKTDSPDPVSAGSNITYSITLTNNGPSDAQTVTLNDAVPANTTFVSVTTPAGWTRTDSVPPGGTGTISFTKPTVVSLETAIFTLIVNVNASAADASTITNSATAGSTTTDPTPGNNTGTATTTVVAMVDLAVTKSDSPDPVLAGNNITYTISFQNNGPAAASNVTVTDATPLNTTFVSAAVTTGSGWTPTSPAVGGTGNVVFSKASVANGETAVFTIVVKVNANTASGSTIMNSVTAATTSTDSNNTNNTATADTTVNTQADLSVTKTDTPDPVGAGANITYTITVTNIGPSDAQSVSLTDVVPANTTFVSESQTTGPAFSCTNPPAGGTGTTSCTITTLAAGATATFEIVVKVNPSFGGASITNTADVATTTTDPTAGNNSATATTAVNVSADLAVLKTDSPDPVNAGANITYTINFSNAGPSDAQMVTVTDAVPANTTFVSAAVTTGLGWGTTTPPVGGTGNVVFSKPTVVAGETAVFTIFVKVNADTASGSTITNNAVASSPSDSNTANNTGTATTTVVTSADLAVTKSDSPDPAFSGGNITYTVNLTNNGPSDAQTVTVTDAVPANTTFVSATAPAGWTPTTPAVGGTGNVVFSKPTVAAAETAAFTIVVKVDSSTATGTIITNSATAASATTDPDNSNNTGTTTTTIASQADLSVTKTDSPDPVTAGTNLTYTISFSNNGPGSSNSVTVTDATPANTTFVSATAPAGWTPTTPAVGGTGNVVFSKATVAASETAVFTMVVNVNANAASGSTITNSAVTASATADPDNSNDTGTATTTVNTSADLSVTKTDTPDPVIAGNNLTYTITFSNLGPSDAQGVTVTDSVPAGTSLVSATVVSGTGWTTGGAVTFSKATVAAGETATFEIIVKVASSTTAVTVINNSATAAATTTDPVSGNNTSSTTTNVIVQADLSVTKSDSPDPVTAGTNLTYTIDFSNLGPSDAQSVTVTDAVPANTTFVSAVQSVGGGWSIASPAVGGTGNVVFSKTTSPAGEMASFTMVVNVNPGTANGTTITNSATAATATTDPTGGNNTGTTTTTVAVQADLAVTKSDSPDPVLSGNNITYTVSFVNNGPSVAQNVTVTDAVPANTTFVSATAPAGWASTTPLVGGTGNVIFSRTPVASGETATFTIVVKVNSSAVSGTITNSATAASTTADGTPGNNTGTTMTGINTSVDLAITKTDSPDPVTAGQNLTYTINFINNGPSDAQTVSITDPVPANSTFVSATAPAGWTSTTPPVGGTGNIIFTKPTTISGETAIFTIVVNVNASTASGTTITNSAVAASSTTDANPSTNTATTMTTVQTIVDLMVTKTDSPDPVTAGNNLTYTINFTNPGPSNAQTVTVTDAVPANSTFVSATAPAGWAATAPSVGGTGNVVFSKGTVAAGETAVFTMVVKVNANTPNGTTITNSATALSSTTESSGGSNTGTATTTVQTSADIVVTKTESSDPVVAGSNLTYTINFTNNGPSDAQSVTVTDAVPANTTFVSASVTTGIGWTITAPPAGGTGNVVFSKPTAAAGETAVFRVIVKVNSNTPSGTTITNNAVGASTTSDPSPGNSTGTATTAVNLQADLAVTKSDSPDPVVASQNLTYTINFANNGPSNASTVTVTDPLPANTTFVSATAPAGWTSTTPPSGGTGTVTFAKPTVVSGETAVFTIVVNVNLSTPNNTVLTNSATAASPTPDGTPGNNTGTTTTLVVAQADLAVTKTDSPDPVCVNGNITYTITFTNNGPGPGINTTVTDGTPANTTFVSAAVISGAGWGTTMPGVGGTGNVVFSKASTASGETATFQVVVKVNAGTVHHTVISNSATAASSIPDPNMGNNTGTATTTVDPNPPTFTNGCPGPISTAGQASCPFATAGTVSFATPAVSDNCSATVACVPPSGSMFPTGTTTVTCTATDTAGNTATCSFPVTVFSLCVQDNSNPGNVVLIDTTTGAYRFCCNGVLVASGIGTRNARGCTLSISDNSNGNTVQVSLDTAVMRGTASFKQGGNVVCTIQDSNLANNTCVCN
jgi:uncharacterized repeat protein (TIGR01451 family)